MSEGIVYVLSNPAMPGMVKIGKTGREVEARLNDLYTTGVPLPFECAYAAGVADMDKVEKAFHNAFGPYRINPRREFFSIEPEQAIGLLDLMKLEDMTPAMQREAEQVDTEAKASSEKLKRQKKPRMNFADIGIADGSPLVFRNGQTCFVEDPRHVRYDDTVFSLSALTQKLMDIEWAVQPSPYWTFNGKNLKDIYDETYAEY